MSLRICGLQKLSLLDFPGKVAVTVFLGGCDLKCPYCHNSGLIGGAPAIMGQEEFFAFLKSRRGLVDGVAISGGEPLLNPSLPGFAAGIKEMGFAVKLDTNGTSPRRLGKMVSTGVLDYIAMDIKNSRAKYPLTVGIAGFDTGKVAESAQILLEGNCPFEFRTTVVGNLHEEGDFYDIAKWIAGAPRYFLQPFTDRETVPQRGLRPPAVAQLHRYMHIVKPHVNSVELRGI